jgi:hypothetical protein
MPPVDEKKADAYATSDHGTADSLDMSPSQERAIKRKIDLAIIPYCSLLYLLSASAPTRSLFSAETWIFPFSGFLDRVRTLLDPVYAEDLILSVPGQYRSSTFGGS